MKANCEATLTPRARRQNALYLSSCASMTIKRFIVKKELIGFKMRFKIKVQMNRSTVSSIKPKSIDLSLATLIFYFNLPKL